MRRPSSLDHLGYMIFSLLIIMFFYSCFMFVLYCFLFSHFFKFWLPCHVCASRQLKLRVEWIEHLDASVHDRSLCMVLILLSI